MSEDKKKLHRTFAVDCFNRTWDLIEKGERTPEEDEKNDPYGTYLPVPLG